MRQSFAYWGAITFYTIFVHLVLPRRLIFNRCDPCLQFREGDVALVTGASTGIGASAAQQFQQRGAETVFAARSVEQCHDEIDANKPCTALAHAMYLNLASFDDVRKFAAEFKKKYSRLDYLVCNAAYKGEKRTTSDALEQSVGVNHYGHALLIHELWPVLTASGTSMHPSRVVIVASDIHKFPSQQKFVAELNDAKVKYMSWTAYNLSKLMNVAFGIRLAKMAEGTNVNVQIVHPGTPVRSKLIRHDTFCGLRLAKLSNFLITLFGRWEWEGAQNLLYGALNGKRPGLYFENLTEASPSNVATNKQNQERLWEKTCRVLSIKYNWPALQQ